MDKVKVRAVCVACLFLLWSVFAAAAGDEFFEYDMGGSDSVTLWIYSNGSGRTFFAPHDNENSAGAAAVNEVRKRGGRAVQLVHSGSRNISFNYEGVRYVFDPNRMFTNQGIKATLLSQGRSYSNEAHQIVSGFAQYVFKRTRGSGEIVALHNNTEGAYSIISYLEGGQFASHASQVYANPGHDPDDFFLVTTLKLFAKLKNKGFNVALQSRAVPDDGSLSVYCAKNGIPYVNVEAQHGHTAAQTNMLAALRG